MHEVLLERVGFVQELTLSELRQLEIDLDDHLRQRRDKAEPERKYGRRTGRIVLQRIIEYREAHPRSPIPASIANDAGRRALNARFVEMSKPIRIRIDGQRWNVAYMDTPYAIEATGAPRVGRRHRTRLERARHAYECAELIRAAKLLEAELREDPDDLEALVLRSRCLIDGAWYAEAVAVLGGVLRRVATDSVERIAAMNNLGVCYRQLRRLEDARDQFEHAEKLAKRAARTGDELGVLINRCDLLLVVDEVEKAHRLVRTIVKRAGRKRQDKSSSPDGTLLGYVYHMQGRVLERVGIQGHPEARRSYEDALSQYERTHRKVAICRVLSELGTLARRQARYDDARQLHSRAMKCAESIGYREAIALEQLRLAQLDILNARADVATGRLNDAFRRFSELERLEGLGYVEYTRAVSAEQNGRRKEMQQALRRATRYFRTFDNPRIDDDCLRMLRREREPLELFELEDRWDIIDVWLMGLPW